MEITISIPGCICPECQVVYSNAPLWTGKKEDDLGTAYECHNCGFGFAESESIDGCSNRCPDCGRYCPILARHACPDCLQEAPFSPFIEVEAHVDEKPPAPF